MINLEKFEKSDFKKVTSWISSPLESLLWAGGSLLYPFDDQQLDWYMEETYGEFPKRMIFKAVDMESGLHVGHIDLSRIDRMNRSARICRVLVDPDLRSKGIASQMTKALIRKGFEELKLHRIELNVFDFNKPAITAYLKAGFREEGTLRDYRLYDGQFLNLIRMSIIENEWRSE